ncbi:MAG TPA: polyprenyl diphosphate synthase [Ardenticatenaceae bacterium]|nr:polyprenyl diphosphate synthase [Ardenticatenaceae bacterium]
MTETAKGLDLELTRVPAHVAIIMDGNGRWARQRGLPRLAGHRAGTENLRRILEACVEFGIRELTIYAFSTENWKRPVQEVTGLLSIFERVIDRELDELNKQGVQLRHIGRKEGLRPDLLKKVERAEELTRSNRRLILNGAFNYGGRAESLDAARQLLRSGIDPETLDEATFHRHLYTSASPDPDLIIRTGGEHRLSNFLLWQAAYSEIYSTPAYWPDFDKEELRKAILEYERRERRFGRVPDAKSSS